jgi:predicted HD superfamily hydrolase involved in NAD metabolism
MDLELLQQATKKALTSTRWEHTLRVVDTALQLAHHHEDVDPTKAKIAATFHDYCKCWPIDQLRAWIEEYHPDLLHYHAELWHAPVAAEVARIDFSLHDEDILHAIRSHTSARPGMSPLEKVIYLADFTEPYRDFPGVDHVRELAKIDLDNALYQALDTTLIQLIERQKQIYPLTLEARNEYLQRVIPKEWKREESI